MKSGKFQGHWVISSACVQFSNGKVVLYSVEAQEEMSGLWPSLSSDGCACSIMGHANKPLMTNANFSWCNLISAYPSKHIKQRVNWDFEQIKCQGVPYKAAKELLPPYPAWGACRNKVPGILPQCIWRVLRLGQPILASALDHVRCRKLSLLGPLISQLLVPNFLVQQARVVPDLNIISSWSPTQPLKFHSCPSASPSEWPKELW